RSVRYDGTWRDRDPAEAPAGVDPVIRLKAPQEGATTVHDLVQGEVTVGNSELDDLILLRADGTPTYNLSVVVDDHDMGITHVIRGDDHLNNGFRQTQIYRALDWPIPEFAHVPLIHGADGAKLSKRHGAVGVALRPGQARQHQRPLHPRGRRCPAVGAGGGTAGKGPRPPLVATRAPAPDAGLARVEAAGQDARRTC